METTEPFPMYAKMPLYYANEYKMNLGLFLPCERQVSKTNIIFLSSPNTALYTHLWEGFLSFPPNITRNKGS